MWTTFECQAPDFQVRSLSDDVTFGVNRAAMQRSEVFRDMFLIPPSPDAPEEAVGLDESAESLTILLKILHDPPNPPTEITTDPYQRQWDPSTVIPLPLLELVILKLADKYILDEWIVKNLDNHLLAHASTHGLRVYGIALCHFRKEIANLASPHVQTMARYTREEVKCLPTVEAYHDLVRFQDFRVKALRDLVLNEDIFPHGYGACSTHQDSTPAAWDARRKALLPKIESGSDVAFEMRALEETLKDCAMCHKACIAAVEMLTYKCRKIPWAIHKLPEGYLSA